MKQPGLPSKGKRPAQFDRNLVVIGAGSAGLVSAYIAAALKARVTLVERGRMGGDCLNTGCVPSKTLIRAARLASDIRHARAFGITCPEPEIDFRAVMERVRRVIGTIAPHDSPERYTELGVEVIAGHARLLSPWEVEITGADGSLRHLSSRSFVIATGAAPAVPAIEGLADIDFLTTDTVWNLDTLPDRLLVLGGGPVGCELAQAFARLGTRVTLVEMASQLLVREDDDVAAMVLDRFRAEGIEVLLAHEARRFLKNGDAGHGGASLIAARDGGEVSLPFDRVLLALGRSARLSGFGLEELGIRMRRTIEASAFLQTSVPNIYVAGDVAGPWQFTHTAAHQAWYAAVNALFSPFVRLRADYSIIPSATFVEPEVARVGLNEKEALHLGIAHEITRYDLGDLDRAIADGHAQGFVKVLTPPGSDRVLGTTIVGEHAADLLAEFILAMRHGIGLKKILGTIHIYPTLAEANKFAAGAWRKAHAPRGLLRWLQRFHEWRRG